MGKTCETGRKRGQWAHLGSACSSGWVRSRVLEGLPKTERLEVPELRLSPEGRRRAEGPLETPALLLELPVLMHAATSPSIPWGLGPHYMGSRTSSSLPLQTNTQVLIVYGVGASSSF